jgi:hypothetical protein
MRPSADPKTIRRAVAMMQPYDFDRVYGGWWGGT